MPISAPLQATACRNHAERPAIGRCTACGRAFCEECATRIEGILRCASCLTATSAAPRGGWRSLSAVAPALLLTPVAWLALALALQAFVSAVAMLQALAREELAR